MAKQGDVILHPVIGERIVFLKTAAETNGELLQIEMQIAPHGFIPGEHIHPYQAEYFKILSGTITFRVGGRETQLTAGQEITVPAGMRHRWWNASDEPGKLIVEFRPAQRMAEFFESFWGLAQDGKVNPKTGLPPLLWAGLLFGAHRRDIYGTDLPRPLMIMLFALLTFLARLRGYRLPYPYPYAREQATASDRMRVPEGSLAHTTPSHS